MDIKEWERRVLTRKYGDIPDQCPTCHASRIVRIVWKPAYYDGGPLGSAIRDGQAILVGKDRPDEAPDWVCPACEPGWEAVYLLVQEEDDWQQKMERALSESDVNTAIEHRDRRNEVKRRRLVMVTQLLAARRPEG